MEGNMNNLNYIQEYYLCAINSKGTIPLLKEMEIQVCFLAGILMELIEKNYVNYDEKKRFIVNKADNDLKDYQKMLYKKIAEFKKPKDAKGILDYYLLGFSQKEFKEMLTCIGVSLFKLDLTEELQQQGMRKNKTYYVPKPEAVTLVIEKLRAELLEEGVITDETVCLAALLDKSRLIQDYFSKIEAKALKVRLQEIRQSDAYASIKEMLDYIEMLIAAMIAITAVNSAVS